MRAHQLAAGVVLAFSMVPIGSSATAGVVRPPESIPASLEAGACALAGMDCAVLGVHRNSASAAMLTAWSCVDAFDWSVPTGVARCVSPAHDSWHVVQQRFGRELSRSTFDDDEANDDEVLESAADQMGARALAGS